MYKWHFLRHHNIQGPKILQGVTSWYEDTLQTNGDIPICILYIMSPTGSEERLCKRRSLRLLRTNSSMKTFEENITKFKRHLMERGYPQNFINHTLSQVRFEQRTQALLQLNETKKTNLALHNTIPPGSSKSQRNFNKEVVPNTATTIPKFSRSCP